MPSNETVRRQRALGGAVGVLVLGFALSYHFYPRLFHVDPSQLAQRQAMSNAFELPGANPASASSSAAAAQALASQANAGPPLTLAPTDVIARRLAQRDAHLPKQLTPDPPAIKALLAQADKALAAGRLIGSDDSAAALYARALQEKPDSRRAALGLDNVDAHLVTEVDQALAAGDEVGAGLLIGQLRTLPTVAQDVAKLEAKLKVLHQVQPLLTEAAGLQQQGAARPTDAAAALAIYRRVQRLDPENAVAEQGVLNVQRLTLDKALAAAAQNNFAAADAALKQAALIQRDSQPLQDVRAQIDAIRGQRAGGLLIQANSALDAGNPALARELAAQAQAISPELPGMGAFEARMTNTRLYAGYRPGEVFSDRYVDLPGQAPAMVVVPTGSVQMGNPRDGNGDAQPQHEVTLAIGFAMARSAITVGQFREFVRASGYVPESVRVGGASVYDERTGTLRDDPDATWQDDYAGRPAADNLPVVNVSWNDARAYAQWLSQHTGKIYRLPSEAEFEYALRAGTTTRYWWGDGAPKTKVENLTGGLDRSPSGRRWSNAFPGYRDGYWGPAPVMSFQPNPLGLYDMDGNVSEWTADCWHDNYLRAPVDGSAWINPGCATRVLRGGSWGSAPSQDVSWWRQGVIASLRSARVGFRVVRVL